jgi:hypothetical protein
MNALAVQVERVRLDSGGRGIRSFFHAMWAIGSFLGSFAMSIVGTGVGLAPHQTLLVCALGVAGLGLAALAVAYAITPDTEPIPHQSADGVKVAIPKAAYLMGLMAIAFGLGEGTASDWSGNHVQAVAGVDPRTATWAVTLLILCSVSVITGFYFGRRTWRKPPTTIP